VGLLFWGDDEIMGGMGMEWISVNHGLPEDNLNCLVVIEGKFTPKFIRICVHRKGFWRSEIEHTSYSESIVTHWMPLPQLPRAGE
jgi:hypothetical protein